MKKYTKTNPITVEPDISITQLMEDYFYHHYHKLYPPEQQTAANVTKQYRLLSKQHHSDHSQGKGDGDVMQRKLNNARDQLKPLADIDR